MPGGVEVGEPEVAPRETVVRLIEVAEADAAPVETGVRRYQAISLLAILGACIPYLWVAWDEWTGRINPLRVDGPHVDPIFDVQARAIMHGHLWIPPGSIGIEAFEVHGHEYTYFGIFPSLLRIPIFLFTSSLDGKLFGLSITAAWIVTAVFCSLLLWRLRIFLRGNAELGWLEAASYGVFLLAILVGSVLIFLVAKPNTYTEDEAWSVALFCGCLFALLGVVERPSWRRITLCGALVLLTNLNRGTTGYAAILATVLVALWFALGHRGRPQRHWALALAGAALVPLAIGCAIDMAKFGMLFGIPFSKQYLFQGYGIAKKNGGHYFSLHWLPSTLKLYVDPTNIGFSSVFPYFYLPGYTSNLLGWEPTASVPLSMPLLFLSGLWGVTKAFLPGQSKRLRVLRLLLIASAVPAAAMLIFGWVYERYVADFVPLLVLAGMIGIVDVWRRLGSRSTTTRVFVSVAVAVLAWLSIWANVGFSMAPLSLASWSRTQLTNYVDAQRAFSDVTGHPLEHKVIVASHYYFPGPEPAGTLFVRGHCATLYIAIAPVPSQMAAYFVPNVFYFPLERAPHTAICESLIKKR